MFDQDQSYWNDKLCAFKPCLLWHEWWRIKVRSSEIFLFTHWNVSPLPQWLWPPNLTRWWPWGAPTNKVTWPFDYVVFWNHLANWKHLSTSRVPLATKLDRIVTVIDFYPCHMIFWSCGLWRSHDKLNCYLSPTKVAVATKFHRTVTYLEWLLPIEFYTWRFWSSSLLKSHETLKPLYQNYQDRSY